MEIKVLGKYGPFAINGSTSSYLVKGKNSFALLDCGSGIVKKLLNDNVLDKLSFIFLSHLHFDHISDIGVLSYAINFNLKGKKLKLYTHIDDSLAFKTIQSMNAFEIINVEENVTYTEGEFSFSCYKMTHPVTSYGIKIENDGKVFAYSGDTTLNDNIYNLIKGASLILLDGAFLQKDFVGAKPHMSIKQVCEIAKESGIKTVVTHLSPTYSDNDVEYECNLFGGNVVVAKEDQTYKV
ncbi:MAG: MBL fold metallo-hydrolase [Clostridia bacterium]|nr:MBL fold metallo-hydrolase [Clostridia bacterium]